MALRDKFPPEVLDEAQYLLDNAEVLAQHTTHSHIPSHTHPLTLSQTLSYTLSYGPVSARPCRGNYTTHPFKPPLILLLIHSLSPILLPLPLSPPLSPILRHSLEFIGNEQDRNNTINDESSVIYEIR